MSRARHGVKKASGGMVYSGKDSNVVKEAEEKKRGGAVKPGGKAHGDKPKARMDKKARGGSSTSSPFAPGSARHPFSSAAKGK